MASAFSRTTHRPVVGLLFYALLALLTAMDSQAREAEYL